MFQKDVLLDGKITPEGYNTRKRKVHYAMTAARGPKSSQPDNKLKDNESSTRPLLFRRQVLLSFLYRALSYPLVIPDLHVLEGIPEDLGQSFVRLFLHHLGDLAIGFLQNLNRLSLPDLLIVLYYIENNSLYG